MALSWTVKRQLLYFSTAMLALAGIAGLGWFKATEPTCFDKKQNQKEEGVDCGGSCAKECVGVTRDLYVLWSMPLKVTDGKYDAVAVVENNNLSLRAPSVGYQFKLYDSNNILIAAREGKTFINPGQKFAVFESNINTGNRIPARAFLEFDKNIDWQIYKEAPLSINVENKDYSDDPRPTLTAVLNNKSIENAAGIYVVGIVYDKDGNAVAASATNVDKIIGGKSKEVFFTWPRSLEGRADTNDIFFRIKSVESF